MRLSRTLRTVRPSFSTADGSVNLTAPRSWRELTSAQLRYTLWLLATFDNHTVVKTYMFCRFTGVHVVSRDRFGWKCYVRTSWWRCHYFTMQAWQVESFLTQLGFVDSYEDMGVRLEDVCGLHAVDTLLHGVVFVDYLNAEKYYQAYMLRHDDRFLKKLALILYRRRNGHLAHRIRLDRAEALGVVLWFSYVKAEMSRAFPHFFRRVDAGTAGDYDMLETMNTQIRALTDGDVTKEQTVLNIDCWRALTELDQKAREAAEFKRKYGK
ncbi:MAG: hypothetical protein Q4C43_04350 [Prevotella sp.]|nr:hypothetical protein [Prevotella sp.]MDO4933799.1 hypothetical protein [Prevotella sp.]